MKVDVLKNFVYRLIFIQQVFINEIDVDNTGLKKILCVQLRSRPFATLAIVNRCIINESNISIIITR